MGLLYSRQNRNNNILRNNKEIPKNHDKNKFILLTSKICGHCQPFKKNQMPKIKSVIDKKVNLDLFSIEIPTFDNKEIPEYAGIEIPKNLENIAIWYPFIIMISKKDWNYLMKNGFDIDPNKVLTSDGQRKTLNIDYLTNLEHIEIFNAQELPLTSESIIKWINENLSKPKYQDDSDDIEIKNQDESKYDIKNEDEEKPQDFYKITFVAKR